MPRRDGDNDGEGDQTQSPTLEHGAAAVRPASTPHPVVRANPSGSGSTPGMQLPRADELSLSGATTAAASRSQAMRAVELPADGPDTMIGMVLAERYEITRKIGSGGMGAVYEATHKLIGKRVAVKVLLDKYAQRDRIVARLEQEARLASSIGHENIVDITDFGVTEDGRTFVVMEYLDGESLAACLAREGTLPPERAIRICKQVASALGAAHKKGIIHRDIKPENCYLIRRGDQDFVKVVDFGISKSLRPSEDDAGSSPRLTQTGMVLGTPLYMSPEQARGDEELDHRIDIYALGVILYELTTGEVPFRGGNYLNIIAQVLSETPKPPRQVRPDRDISESLEAVILKALAKDVHERYQTMEELAADLSALLSDGEVAAVSGPHRRAALRKRSRSVPIIGWVAAIAVVAGGVVLAVRFLVGGDRAAPASGVAAAVVPPPAAAIAAEPRPEAPPVGPKVAEAIIEIRSIPLGATVLSDDGTRTIGTTPFFWHTEDVSGHQQLILQLDGYDEAKVKVSPHFDNGKAVEYRLQKVKKGAKAHRVNRATPVAPQSKPGDVPDDTAGGELPGNPYRNKKKDNKKKDAGH